MGGPRVPGVRSRGGKKDSAMPGEEGADARGLSLRQRGTLVRGGGTRKGDRHGRLGPSGTQSSQGGSDHSLPQLPGNNGAEAADRQADTLGNMLGTV